VRQPFIPHNLVKPFNVRILQRLARLNKLQPDALLLRPGLDRGTDVLGAIFATYHLRLSSPADDLFQRIHDLAVAIPGFLHLEPIPLEKILLLASTL
jgi:hypothetical protein